VCDYHTDIRYRQYNDRLVVHRMTVDIVKLHLPTLKLITKGNVQFHVTICYPLFCFLFLLITKLEGLRVYIKLSLTCLYHSQPLNSLTTLTQTCRCQQGAEWEQVAQVQTHARTQFHSSVHRTSAGTQQSAASTGAAVNQQLESMHTDLMTHSWLLKHTWHSTSLDTFWEACKSILWHQLCPPRPCKALSSCGYGTSVDCNLWGLLKFEFQVSSIKNERIRCFLLIQLKLETGVFNTRNWTLDCT